MCKRLRWKHGFTLRFAQYKQFDALQPTFQARAMIVCLVRSAGTKGTSAAAVCRSRWPPSGGGLLGLLEPVQEIFGPLRVGGGRHLGDLPFINHP